VSVTASYTRLVTEQLNGDPSTNGKPLPREPGHAVYARAALDHRIAGHLTTVWSDVAWQSASALDPAGQTQVPGRALLGAGARVELTRGLGAALSVENLGDVRITHLPLDPPPSPQLTEAPTALTDVAGFPLPGRSWYFSLDWSY
jgi:outer membrane receptor protein involved in Fe transport